MVKTAMIGARNSEGSEVTSQSTITIAPTVISNNTSLQIIAHKLNGKNYLQWSRSVLMVIQGRGQLGYLDHTTTQPDESYPEYMTWDAQNSMVMAWLVNSMNDDIEENYLYHTTAKDLWEAVKRAYSDLENSTQMFELRNKARKMTQSELDMT